MYNINNLFIEIQNENNEFVLNILNELGINSFDNYNRTALMNAAFYNNIPLVETLIQSGANLNQQDKIGYTALHFAAQEGNTSVVKLLLEKSANPNLTDNHGNTAAWVTIMNWKAGKNFETLKLLVKFKTDLSIKNNAGHCTLDIIPERILSAILNN